MFIVSGGQTSNGRYLSLQPPSDWPQNTMDYESRETFDHFKVADVVKVYEATGVSNRFGRNALRPIFPEVDDNRVDKAWPTGAVWLMVSRWPVLILVHSPRRAIYHQYLTQLLYRVPVLSELRNELYPARHSGTDQHDYCDELRIGGRHQRQRQCARIQGRCWHQRSFPGADTRQNHIITESHSH